MGVSLAAHYLGACSSGGGPPPGPPPPIAATGRIHHLELAPTEVAPGAGGLRLVVAPPPGHRLNAQAEARAELASSDPAVAELGERVITFRSGAPGLALPIPAVFHPGNARLTVTGVFYYCLDDRAAICRFQAVEAVLPVTVRPENSASEIVFPLVLPEPSAP